MNHLIVETRYGSVQGTYEKGVCVWKGIPYAKPPIGPLRFQAPQPPDHWTGIRDATEFGPAAMQMKPKPNLSPKGISEDCLYLNIWSPAADDRRRPVMFWVHGGFFMAGSGSDPQFNGAAFAANQDVVLVTINYRLGPFGFLQLRDIGGEKYADSGNCGILDQIAALKWVRENIAAFGGDPERITIFGQSAGGRSVGLLLSTPSAAGLFQRAIIHSGALRTYGTAEDAGKIVKPMMDRLGIDKVEQLQEVSADQLMKAAPPPSAGDGLGPNIDGKILPYMPLDAIQAGLAKQIDIMIGWTLHDFERGFKPEWKNMTEQEIMQDFEQKIGNIWKEVSPYYLQQKEAGKDLLDQLLPLLIRNEFIAPATRLVELQARHGSSAWLYRFDWLHPRTGLAMHGNELDYVFYNLDPEEGLDTLECRTVARQMQSAWAAFARTGKPNSSEIPDWPPYELTQRPTMVFDLEARLVMDLCKEERLNWESAGKRLKTS